MRGWKKGTSAASKGMRDVREEPLRKHFQAAMPSTHGALHTSLQHITSQARFTKR